MHDSDREVNRIVQSKQVPSDREASSLRDVWRSCRVTRDMCVVMQPSTFETDPWYSWVPR